MTANGLLFTNFTLQVICVTLANVLRSNRLGPDDVAVELGDKKSKLIDVLYVPNLDANLSSISDPQARGITAPIQGEQCGYDGH